MNIGQSIVIAPQGTNKQLQKLIEDAVPMAVEQTKSIARQFKGSSEEATARNIFNFLLTKIKYKADGQHQQVKLPSALLRTRVGDCKSYALFTAAILTNLNIPYVLVYASYSNSKTPEHVYVMTQNGVIIDAVWKKFNSEKPANHKIIKNENQFNQRNRNKLSGIIGG